MLVRCLRQSFRLLGFLACMGLFAACKVTRHVPDGQHLLRSNNLNIKSDRTLTNRGALNDALSSLIIQKPNTYFLGLFPYKVWLYNLRYKRFARDTSAEAFQKQLRTVERPVIYDTALAARSVLHMRSYLFNQGYFYSIVKDTVRLRGKKATAIYEVETGLRYLINKTSVDADDSTIRAIVTGSLEQSLLREGKPFTRADADQERYRIATLLRNHGYYKLTSDNVRIVADTVNKVLLKDAANPFESAINFLALQRVGKNPTLDVNIIIRKEDEPNAYRRYKIGKVRVYPDFIDRSDITDSTMYEKVIGDVTFRYHEYYVREKVLLNHIFMKPGQYYTQDDYDLTVTKLNELGLFQFVQTYIIEDSTLPPDRPLRVVLLMNPTKKYDFSANANVTNGTTYTLGINPGINLRNRNLLKGANQLSITLNGGFEWGYDTIKGKSVIDRLYLLSRSIGANATIDFPKFIAPFSLDRIIRPYQTHTILAAGVSLLERVNYFTLINTSASFNYNWRRNAATTWDFSPIFVNVLRMPKISEEFQGLLNSNDFLRNSYTENFIEGENLFFTYTDRASPKSARRYSYLRAGVEEAGALLSLINAGVDLRESIGLNYSQYFKLEADGRHYIRRQHAELATRLFAGVGIPYGNTTVLPYIKQYFVGGPYSLRGWRVRQLGPGSYRDTSRRSAADAFIDRTGDIKLEANAELRFDVIPLFGDALRLNGALFVDAGNIWLAQPSANYPGGEFNLSRLGSDLAISTGLGARVDISGLFVLRIDLGFPLKNPGVEANTGWIDAFRPFKGDWQRQNLVTHIAIGYPF